MYEYLPKGMNDVVDKHDWYCFLPVVNRPYCRVPAIFEGQLVKYLVAKYRPDELVICRRKRVYISNAKPLPLP